MSAWMTWRVAEQRGDRILALLMLVISVGLALSMQLGRSFESPAARDMLGGLGQFIALFLAFRYAFAGGRAWMLAVDAKRARLPVLPDRILRVEALRAVVFALVPALPFALAGALPVAESIFAAALTGVSIGILFSITPYRFILVLGGGVFAFLIGNHAGVLAWTSTGALVASAVLFACTGCLLRWRISSMAASAADAEVGGAYSVAVAVGRHSGSIWSAPDTAPLQAMSKSRPAAPTPRSPLSLLSEPLARRLASPGRDLRDWALTLGLFPVLITGTYVSFAALDGAAMPALQRVFGLIWPAVVLMWVPFAAVAFLWLGTFRQVREHLRPGHPVHDALHLLPGMPVGLRAWRTLLLPVVWPPLAVGLVLLLSTIPLIPGGTMQLLPVVAASLVVVLVSLQPAVAVSLSDSAPARGTLVAGLSGLLLLALYLVTGITALPVLLAL